MRLMMKCRGSISVFLICIMIPMVVFEGLLIDGSKLLTAKSVASDAGSLAINAVLADYNTVIKDVYGLFAASETEEELQKNVKQYFNETLNAANIDPGVLSGDDLVTFLNMSAEVTASYAAGSQLSNDYVLEQQILEYMKYRGPVNISMGLLDKFTAFSSLSKQQKVVNDKLEYDEKLDDVQKKLQKAYDAINEYIGDAAVVNNAYGNLPDIKETYKDICTYLLRYQQVEQKKYSETWPRAAVAGQASLKVSASESKDDVKNYLLSVLDDYNKPGSLSMYQNWKRAMASYVAHINNGELNCVGHLSDMDTLWGEIATGSMSYEAYIAKFQNYYSRYKSSFSEKDDAYENLKNLHDRVEEDVSAFNVGRAAKKYQSNLDNKVQALATAVYTPLHAMQGGLKSGISNIEEAVSKLKKAQEAVSQLQALKEQWSSDANALPEGEIKNGMVSEANARTESLDEEALEKLVGDLNTIKTAYEQALEAVESIKFNSHVLYDYHPDNYLREYIRIIPADAEDSQAAAVRDTNLEYKEIVLGELPDITKDDFYKYLSVICKKGDEPESQDSSQAKKDRNAMLGEGSVDGITVDVTGKYTASASGENGGSESVTGSKADDKEVSDAAQDSMKNTAGLFDKLESFLVESRDLIYIEEYATEMFSCYTSDEKAVSLSGNAFVGGTIPSKNFKSEVEYILFGKEDAVDNVKASRNRIFGIRFLLNLLYAFTGDAEIKSETLTMATAIAGWTGFGVPIVQNVLIVAMALVESVYDTTMLMKGKDVPIYKCTSTWIIKGSNIGQGLKEIGEVAIETGADKMNQWIESVEDAAGGAIEDFEQYLKKMVDEKTDALVSSAVSAVMTPIESVSLSVIPDAKLTDDDLAKAVEDVFSSIESSIAGIADGMSRYAAQVCLEYVSSNCKTMIIDKIKGLRDQVLKGDSVHESLTKAFAKIKEDIGENISGKIKNSHFMEEFKAKMHQYAEELTSAVGDVADAAADKINGGKETIKQKMNDEINKWTSDTSGGGKTGSEANGSATNGAVLTMNYKEYMKLFMVIGIAANHDGIIDRIGMLVELNAQNCDKEEAKKFKLATSYTMVNVKAEVALDTSFLKNLPDMLQLEDSSVPSIVDSDGKYRFDYHGSLSY